MMYKIKLIIFDLDGTLIDAYPAIIDSFNYTMRKLGYPRQGDLTIRRSVGWGDRNLLRPFIKQEDLGKALLIYRGHHKQALTRKSRLMPSAIKVLSYLKAKGFMLAVASNRPTRFSQILIRHLGLGKYFDYVLCADKIKHIKPHPQILNKIMHEFLLKPSQTLYVGDMTIDIQAGRRAKVKTAVVATGSNTIKELNKERPWCILKNIAHLIKRL